MKCITMKKNLTPYFFFNVELRIVSSAIFPHVFVGGLRLFLSARYFRLQMGNDFH